MFRESIQKVVEGSPGALAGVLMGFDGIAVDGFSRPGGTIDMGDVAMELSHVYKQIRSAAGQLEVGVLNEVTFAADNMTVVARLLNDEFFVAVALAPGGNTGKARYLLRIAAPAIRAELL